MVEAKTNQQGWRRSRRDEAGGGGALQQQQLRGKSGAASQQDTIDLTPTEIDSRTRERGGWELEGGRGSLTRHTHLSSKSCTRGGGERRKHTLRPHTATRSQRHRRQTARRRAAQEN